MIASEARKLMHKAKDVKRQLETAIKYITEAATRGDSSIRLDVTTSGPNVTGLITSLRSLGYTVTYHSESSAAPAQILIDWSKYDAPC